MRAGGQKHSLVTSRLTVRIANAAHRSFTIADRRRLKNPARVKPGFAEDVPDQGRRYALFHILPVGSVTAPNPFEMVRFFLKHRGPTLVNSGDPPNRSDQMPPRPEPKRGMPRSLIYALIPGGFILLVIVMVFSGWVVEDEPAPMTEVREEAEEISE